MITNPVFATWSALAAKKVLRNLTARGFEAHFCATGEEAAQKALALIPKTDTVSWGGSMTLGEVGIYQKLRNSGYTVIDRDTASNPEGRTELMRQALTCGTFLTSVNAISEDGVLVNIDGVGNRIAAMTFGPRQVVVIVGMNKLAPDAAGAHARARHYASPVNVTRLGVEGTPCAAEGTCGDCKSGICTYIMETRQSRPIGRIKVILVGESLGY